MHFFFGISNENFKSEIQIPIFKHTALKTNHFELYKLYPEHNKWIIKKSEISKKDELFYLLKDKDIANHEIYFLATEKQIKNFNNQEIINFNDLKVRANLKIYIQDKGFSSYQSDYPYEMTTSKNSNVVASINSLANKYADKNFIFFKNIISDPKIDEFEGYFVNYEKKKIEKKFILKTNYSNCIEIERQFIKPEIFFVAKNYVGIPVFISSKNGSLSVEHTHPPHSFIVSSNRYKIVKILKEEFNEIIN